VRDKAKMVGGLGICGRPFCCASFLDDFQPVSIKMAKTQNLSLNPTKISGTCGRLMCCLKYEQDAYEDLIRTSPKMDSFVDTPEGRGTVVEIDLLRQRVKVRMEDAPETISVFANTDIAILRSGKAKKGDAPIPDDLAPISGNGKRVKREEADTSVFLEPIRFRYSEEAVVEQPDEPKEYQEEAPAEEKPSRSRRRRRGSEKADDQLPKEELSEQPKKEDKPKKDKKQPEKKEKAAEKKEKQEKKSADRKEKPAKPQKAEQPAKKEEISQAAPGEEGAAAQVKKRRHRPNHRRKKAPKPQE